MKLFTGKLKNIGCHPSEWDPRLQHFLLRRGTCKWAVAPSIPCLHLVTLKKAELSAIGDIYLHMGLLLLYYRLIDFQEGSSLHHSVLNENEQSRLAFDFPSSAGVPRSSHLRSFAVKLGILFCKIFHVFWLLLPRVINFLTRVLPL